MTRRENESVTVQPVGIAGIVTEMTIPEDIGERSQSHWCSRMPGVGFLDGVHCQHANGVNAEIVKRAVLGRHGREISESMRRQALGPGILIGRRIFGRSASISKRRGSSH